MLRTSKPLSDGQRMLPGMAGAKFASRTKRVRRENPETAVVRFVREFADQHPGLLELRRTHSGTSRRGRYTLYHGREGGLDYTGGTCFGVPLVVECKSENGRLSAEQIETIARYTEWGWIVIVCHSPAQFLERLASAFAQRGHPIDFAGVSR